jgi:hypothetical protein
MIVRPLLNAAQQPSEARMFHELVEKIYRPWPVYRPAFRQEIDALFSKNNPLFDGSNGMRWIVCDPSGQVVGRIAAFIHPYKARGFAQPTGSIGFFECVDKLEVAHSLFDTARDWLAERGMQAMDGPVNFGETDRFWGLQTGGFDHPPFYGMQWHPPYYQKLFRDYGFVPYYRQFSYTLKMHQPLAARINTIGKRSLGRPGVSLRFPSRADIHVFARDMQTIYNEAWVTHHNASPLTEAQVMQLANDLKHILLPGLMPFIYVNDEPAAFAVALPDLYQMLAPAHGNINRWEQLKLLLRSAGELAWYRRRGVLTRARVIAAGVRPRFQKMGLESAAILGAYDAVRALGIEEMEVGWVGDFNPPMLGLVSALCGEPTREHQTLRYLFDRSLPPQAPPVIGF